MTPSRRRAVSRCPDAGSRRSWRSSPWPPWARPLQRHAGRSATADGSRISLSATAEGDDHVAQTLTAIDLEFSEPVDQASVERRFQIEPYVGGTFTWDRDTTAIFTPGRKLPSRQPFRVIVAAGFIDPAGNVGRRPGGSVRVPDRRAPVVLSMSPAPGSTGVATNIAELDFDRLMDTGSVEAAFSDPPARPVPAELERTSTDPRV